jgi:hypothetical protein
MHSNKAVLAPASFKGGNAHIQGFAGTEGPVQEAVLGSEGREGRPLFLTWFPIAKSGSDRRYILPSRSNFTTMLRLIENSVSSLHDVRVDLIAEWR